MQTRRWWETGKRDEDVDDGDGRAVRGSLMEYQCHYNFIYISW